ncbi:hypothetical protein PFISCL1PPCAC_11673, partial [Pristionchus fissidentatus]
SFTVDILDHGKDKQELLQKEVMWIKALNTAFPFGLISTRKTSRCDEYSDMRYFTSAISKLHTDFVVTMVDKASGNYAFTCKKLYLKFMEKELNTESNGDKTYEIQDQTNLEDLKILHERFTRSFGIIPLSESSLPKIYGIPKMHKNPIKFRFITGAYNSTLKPLSMELQKILKFLHVSNSKSDIFCADFSSLFTNLPLNVVKEKLYFLFDILFKNAGSEYMVVHGMKVRYDRNNSSTSGRSYHKNDLKNIVDFILRNSYAFYGGELYKQ